ncbi:MULTISPECIES: hypothetical protein [unclassified Vibrio]|uniref:hypothetical protein n=1 Tax=unclassified Vibrio TaxID=2614977 RepID=UPI000C86300D|nr:hypothetical protein [Vibrio sp. 10N.261.54.E10]PMK06996.1 hypothetical protein BCU07_20725 [Vibrio sp. 10N.261.54.E10]
MKDSIIMDIRKIRAALESFDKSDFHYNTSFYQCLNGFPSGCCGDTSNLLGLFLKNAYGKDSTYISGKGLGNNREQSHAWLVCDGYIIDITADQFNSIGYNLDKVIVSTSSDFHESFSRIDRHEINYDSLGKTPISGVLHKVNERIRNLTPAI